MPEISSRLREGREALGLSQQALADKCGISARSQRNYESGERLPDAAYLAALVSLEMDVLYILTGQRSQPVPESAQLSPRQRALLDNYAHTDEAGKKIIEGTASFAAQSDKRKKA